MQIIYFPYLSLDRQGEINFGDVKVWNFGKKARKYIPDKQLRAYLRKILYSNISHNKKIKDIGVLSIGDTDFRQFNQEEFDTANEIRLILFLSFLSLHNTVERKANAGWYMATSENLEFVIQNFEPYTEFISENTGSIINIGIGGYKIGEKKFYQPSYVIQPQRFSLDGLLIQQLLRLNKKGGKRLYHRILRATDLFFESYYNNPNVSRNARVLLQIAALETLLDLPSRSQRKDFKDKIENFCNLSKEKQYLHCYEDRGRKVPERRSIKAIWADAYYSLRNKIIHGDVVGSKDFAFKGKQRHIDIAILFFTLLIKRLINAKFKKKIFYDEIIWGKTKDGTDVYEGFIYQNNDLDRRISNYFARRRIVIPKK